MGIWKIIDRYRKPQARPRRTRPVNTASRKAA